MNKKICIVLFIIILFIVGIALLFSNFSKQTSSDKAEQVDTDKIWVATFQLVWNEFIDNYVHQNIEFEDGNSELAAELNKRKFTKDMLSETDYYIAQGNTNQQLKETIISDIKNKFNIDSVNALNDMDFSYKKNHYTLYSMLNKKFTFLTPFDKLPIDGIKFNGGNKNIKLFGINNSSSEKINNNVEVLFYNANNDFSVKINTVEHEELILYRTNNKNSFENLYNEILEKEEIYNGSKNFETSDELRVPYIQLEETINYDELCNRKIKNTKGMYIDNAVQNVIFNLTETGGNLVSEVETGITYLSASMNSRYFYFTDTFVLFLKEENKEKPYFALIVDSDEILESFK